MDIELDDVAGKAFEELIAQHGMTRFDNLRKADGQWKLNRDIVTATTGSFPSEQVAPRVQDWWNNEAQPSKGGKRVDLSLTSPDKGRRTTAAGLILSVLAAATAAAAPAPIGKALPERSPCLLICPKCKQRTPSYLEYSAEPEVEPEYVVVCIHCGNQEPIKESEGRAKDLKVQFTHV